MERFQRAIEVAKSDAFRINTYFFLESFAQNSYLSVYLRANGISFENIGIFSFISLFPLILKTAIGTFSDYVHKRRIFIITGLIIQAISLIGLIFVDVKKQFWLYLVVTLILFVGISIYDTTSDGLAVLVSKNAQDESNVQFYLGLGNSFGNILAVGAFGLIAERFGWHIVFFTLVFISALPLIPFFFLRNIEQVSNGNKYQCKSFKVFAVRPVICMILYAILFGMTLYGFGGTIFPRIVQKFNTDVYKIGFMSTTLGIGMACGVVVAKLVLKKVTYKYALLSSCIAHGIAALLLLVIVKEAIAWPIVFILGIAWGNKLTIFLSAAMQFTRKDIAASMYSIYMAFTNVGIALGNLISASFVQKFGFTTTYIFVGLLSILTSLLIPVMFHGDYLGLIHKQMDQEKPKENEDEVHLVEDSFQIEEVESEK